MRPVVRLHYAVEALIGERFGGAYQVVRLLGQGGMGAVYEAEHVETRERVALKCIDGTLVVPGKNGLHRFQREVKAMGAIDTEHMVRVLDAGTDPERKVPFMVMEFLEGEDLQHLLDRVECLEPDTALRIAAQVCIGLQKAHEARVVHRDIKPANLFLARKADGEVVVKILDFGIAKIKPEPSQGGPTTGLTRTGGILGSPMYMSPEQARGLSDIDYRTDLWSLGMVLYVALAGELPHGHISAFGDLIMAICAQPPRSVQAFAPWVQPDVAAVVHRALALDAGDRFPSAASMLEAIRPLVPGGFALREELLGPVRPETRARVATRLSLAHAADDAHRRIARIVVQGGVGSGDETVTVEAPRSESAPGTASGAGDRPLHTTTGGSNITTSTTGDWEKSPQAGDSSAPRARWPGRASAAVGLVAAAGVIAFALGRSSLREGNERVGDLARTVEWTLVLRFKPPPAVSPPPPAVRQRKLRVAPAGVSVEIDGKPVEVRDGEVMIEGEPGTMQRVRLIQGRKELTVEVFITVTGLSRDSLEIEPEKPAPPAPTAAKTRPSAMGTPGVKTMGAPRVTAPPAPTTLAEHEVPLMPEVFK
ncbi:serine/threonine-protein kinase [Sorangium sp. So ce375]|uniref:serine/threonine protein kinase n=1 Tax=Sorangium sp. So ce375 TaxID=3133306 RepID=UPI003F5C1CBA